MPFPSSLAIVTVFEEEMIGRMVWTDLYISRGCTLLKLYRQLSAEIQAFWTLRRKVISPYQRQVICFAFLWLPLNSLLFLSTYSLDTMHCPYPTRDNYNRSFIWTRINSH